MSDDASTSVPTLEEVLELDRVRGGDGANPWPTRGAWAKQLELESTLADPVARTTARHEFWRSQSPECKQRMISILGMRAIGGVPEWLK